MDDQDRRVIACNFAETTNVAPKGALAYVVGLNPGWGNDRIPVLVRSHGSRWVEKWEAMRRLENFRFKTIPPEHPRYGDTRLFGGFNEADLQALRTACERNQRRLA